VAEDGQPKILDFGVARVRDDESEMTVQTMGGQILGTLAYMSPEQVSGDPLEIDTRSDIYALGVVLSKRSIAKSRIVTLLETDVRDDANQRGGATAC
jgi:serine/threonine protein kinase